MFFIVSPRDVIDDEKAVAMKQLFLKLERNIFCSFFNLHVN